MNNPPDKNKTARSGQHPGTHESPASLATFPQRTKRPGQVGLANEARPGLGTRSIDDAPGDQPSLPQAEDDSKAESKIQPPPTRRPEPTEQDPDSLQHILERDTGVSGHSGS